MKRIENKIQHNRIESVNVINKIKIETEKYNSRSLKEWEYIPTYIHTYTKFAC